MQHHPDSEAANEIAAIVMKHLGWVKLDKRYAIANDVSLERHLQQAIDSLAVVLAADRAVREQRTVLIKEMYQ